MRNTINKTKTNTVIKLIFAIVMGIFISEYAHAIEYQNDRILIRFKHSAELTLAKANKPIAELTRIIGEYTSARYVDDALIFEQSKEQFYKLQDASSPYSKLYRTYLVELKGEFDPILLSKKLNTLPFIELAEAMPIAHIVETPNDEYLYEQYYLNRINAFSAWKSVQSTDSILIAIVDTGIEQDHPDLKDVIYYNPGENGTDKDGNDKSNNGIDDDGNGFIDDWRGWDFWKYSSKSKGDNDPTPSSSHGTHVAGICGASRNNRIGIAGLAKNAKLLAIKISDDSRGGSTYNGYHAILYAAKMGARIINCSWGGGGVSDADIQLLKIATSEYNTLVVAAMGNESKYTIFYPASYERCLSVSSSDEQNLPSSFTNYHERVSVTAPGSNIYSTVMGKDYRKMSGTSMATPVVAGVAALVALKYPQLTADEIKHRIMLTADPTFYSKIATKYQGLLGTGVIDAQAALDDDIPNKYATTKAYKFSTNAIDFDLKKGDFVELELDIVNLFDKLENITIEVSIDNEKNALSDKFKVEKNIYTLETLEKKQVAKVQPFRVTLTDDLPIDTHLWLLVKVKEGKEVLSQSYAKVHLNVSYLDVQSKNISATITSSGNICYTDYPANMQGRGFRYRPEDGEMMYEGAFMLAVVDGNNGSELWDMARNGSSGRNKRFYFTEKASKEVNSLFNCVSSEFHTKAMEDKVGQFTIKQKTYAFHADEDANYIILEYNIKNTGTRSFEAVYAGLFLDWDAGDNTHFSRAKYDKEHNFSYTGYENLSEIIPLAGSMIIGDVPINYYPITNDDDIDGIYKDFTDSKKLRFMTNALKKLSNDKADDISEVIAAGPISLASQQDTTFAIALLLGKTREEMIKTSKRARMYKELLKSSVIEASEPMAFSVFPNPSNGKASISTNLSQEDSFQLYLYDESGRKVRTIEQNILLPAGKHTMNIDLGTMPAGAYFLVLKSDKMHYYSKFIIQK